MFRIATVALALLASAATASAQQWAEKLFPEQSHDFGAVPRASKVEYLFPIKNIYGEDLHIASVRSSCGCTIPRIQKDTLKPNEQGAIIAEFNTRAFTGQRQARVTVTIDKPRYAEIQLDVKGYIRTDVVLNPNLVNLGTVAQGQPTNKTIKIDYAGRNDWQITGVTSNSPYITADVKETSRGNGRVGYELDVQLAEGAPAGYVNDQLVLATNDRKAKEFPVAVEGRIEAALAISPAPLVLGNLQPGQKVTKQIVIKGARPFRILEVRTSDDSISFQIPEDSKAVHFIPLTFEASSDLGRIARKIEIITDLDNKSVELPILGQISAPLAGK